MKKRHENIKNELAYFYKVIKNIDLKDNIKQSKINIRHPLMKFYMTNFRSMKTWTNI